ncbi:endonuclease/exonuclease/phosphatase family protein [Glaciecola siphonariae]|uniref:Endonuclease/exonuclease/phosphatase family protein n=1 Tax=Glaciecola siphonariae TaxID=521012 RepID=A0ABV9LR19_9ALTE
MFTFSVITTLCLALISILPLMPSDHWLCRSWEFPRLQIVVLLAINIVFCVYAGQGMSMWLLVLLSAICMTFQCIWILPYTVLFPKEVSAASDTSGTSLKILTANVLMTNRSEHKLIARVKEHCPDVLVTLESDERWQDALSVLHEDYPHRVAVPKDNLYGMHLYSKFDIVNEKIEYLIEEDIPSISCELLIAPNVPVQCHFLHPAPPSPTENEYASPRDKELMLVAKSVKGNSMPTIVTGDLNDVAWSPTTRAFKQVSELQDPRIGRGFFNTFHADYALLRWPLDHIFHSKHFRVADIRRLKSIDSDHFPLLTQLVINAD